MKRKIIVFPRLIKLYHQSGTHILSKGFRMPYFNCENPPSKLREYIDPKLVYQLNEKKEIIKIWDSSGMLYRVGYLNIIPVLKGKGRIKCNRYRFIRPGNYNDYVKKHRNRIP